MRLRCISTAINQVNCRLAKLTGLADTFSINLTWYANLLSVDGKHGELRQFQRRRLARAGHRIVGAGVQQNAQACKG